VRGLAGIKAQVPVPVLGAVDLPSCPAGDGYLDSNAR